MTCQIVLLMRLKLVTVANGSLLIAVINLIALNILIPYVFLPLPRDPVITIVRSALESTRVGSGVAGFRPRLFDERIK